MVNELRIGNLITCETTSNGKQLHLGILSIAGVIKEGNAIDHVKPPVIIVDTGFIHPKDASPIPLTQEWLLKAGFKKNILDIEDDCQLKYVDGNIYIGERYESGGTSFKYKYVHQLQNLYFALTGKELEFNG